MTEIILFPDNPLKPIFDWIRDAIGRSVAHSTEMRRLREQHERWTAGIAIGGIALSIANWGSLAAALDERCVLLAMILSLASVGAAAATTYFSIEIDEKSYPLRAVGDTLLALCAKLQAEMLEGVDPDSVRAWFARDDGGKRIVAWFAQMDGPRAQAAANFKTAYLATVGCFCGSLAAFVVAAAVQVLDK